MSKNNRTYKDVTTGKNLGANSFHMLRYALNNPGCDLESYDPISRETTQQKFVQVDKSQSYSDENNYIITCHIIKNGESIQKTFEVRKVDWE